MRRRFRAMATAAVAAAILTGAIVTPARVHGSAVCPPPPDKLAGLISSIKLNQLIILVTQWALSESYVFLKPL